MNSVVSLINCFNESRNICCKRIIVIQLAYNLYTRNHYYQNSRNKVIALPVNSIAMVKAHSQVRFKFYAMHRVLSLLLILNRFHALFPCFDCNFEQASDFWVGTLSPIVAVPRCNWSLSRFFFLSPDF